MINICEMKMEKVVYSTSKYDEFKFIKSNRGINRNNVENLKKSMKENNILVPIIINEKGEIIDGQHRYTAWKELGFPICFYIVEGVGEEEMIALNINKANWKPSDYLCYFCDNDYDEYLKFDKIKKEYGVQISDLLTVMDELSENPIGENAMGRKFKEGNLDMSNHKKVLEFLHDLQLFKESENYLSTYFIRAFLRLYVSDFYDSEFMEYRTKLQEEKIKRNEKGYTDRQCSFLSEIYTCPRKEVIIIYNDTMKSFYKIESRKNKKACNQ